MLQRQHYLHDGNDLIVDLGFPEDHPSQLTSQRYGYEPLARK